MTGYDFHPEAAIDLDEIWEFVAGTTSTRPTGQLQMF